MRDLDSPLDWQCNTRRGCKPCCSLVCFHCCRLELSHKAVSRQQITSGTSSWWVMILTLWDESVVIFGIGMSCMKTISQRECGQRKIFLAFVAAQKSEGRRVQHISKSRSTAILNVQFEFRMPMIGCGAFYTSEKFTCLLLFPIYFTEISPTKGGDAHRRWIS